MTLEIPVDDIFRMQIVHALRRLSSYFNQREELELSLLDVQVFVQRGTFAPLCNNRQLGFANTAHEQQNIHMPSLPQHRNFIFKSLQLRRRWDLHVQSFDCNWAVPMGLINSPERTRSDPGSYEDLIGVDFPVLDGFPGRQHVLRRLVCGLCSRSFGPQGTRGTRLSRLAVLRWTVIGRNSTEIIE